MAGRDSFSSEWEAVPSSWPANPFGAPLRLLILSEARVLTIPLPGRGEVTLGSASSCHVVIGGPGVAATHAVLRLGEELALRDVSGSAETMVGSARLAPGAEIAVAPGVVMQLGGVAMVIQTSAGSARLRHVRSHDYFEGRLEDECTRAEARGAAFAVVRLRFTRGQARAVEDAFSRLLRSVDLVAMYTADEYELLLADATPELAQVLVAELGELVAHNAPGELQVGVACWPRDGRSPEALLARAGAAIHGDGDLATSSVLTSGAIDSLRPLLERIAHTNINVLVLGETGVGKEVVARQIHQLSPRAKKPLVCLNCAGFTEALLESELFGHERGAFTGAVQTKPGLLESAQGGTVLLDEVGELPLTIQAKLLRVVEHHQVTRLGGLVPRDIDVRFLAATNRDLEAESARGAFRSDLYFRLNGVSLVVPPLRERVGEIAPLARSFSEQFARQAGRKNVPELSRAALGLLERYAWPGNVRELRNVVERAVMLVTGDVIDLPHLPIERLGRTLPPVRHGEPSALVIRSSAPAPQGTLPSFGSVAPRRNQPGSPGAYAYGDDEPPAAPAPTPIDEPRRLTAAEISERARILKALERCVGNQTQAARLLGLTRRALITRLERYRIPRPRKRDDDPDDD
jgi:two-component system, NtrC family, response regulator AtoC